MKGLAIAEAFWREWGQPYIEEHFPHLHDRVAVGRFHGSDVLGADDNISRDHNWGPQFWVWLSEDDYVLHGAALEAAMNAAAPNPWRGYRLNGGSKSVHVVSIARWFMEGLHLDHPPRDDAEWLTITQPESFLYYLRHGALWVDGTGEWSAWRAALDHYPERVRYRRLHAECFRVWHHGEYNFVQRMTQRRDPLAITICLGEFVSGVMRLLMLLRGDFTPYWKWLSFESRKTPDAALYMPLLERVVASRDLDEQTRLVLLISAHVHEALHAAGVVSGQDADPLLLPLLNDAIELERRAKYDG